MGGTCQSLDIEEIVELNRQMIDAFGGSFYDADGNLINRGSLEYVLDAIVFPIFGVERYPTIEEKAAVLGWTIIASHVFHDGNKRTGMLASRVFLQLNGYDLPIFTQSPYNEELINISLGIANNELSLEDFTEWIRSHIQPIQ